MAHRDVQHPAANSPLHHDYCGDIETFFRFVSLSQEICGAAQLG